MKRRVSRWHDAFEQKGKKDGRCFSGRGRRQPVMDASGCGPKQCCAREMFFAADDDDGIHRWVDPPSLCYEMNELWY